jgi:REP element-mobilizing transposase RayT
MAPAARHTASGGGGPVPPRFSLMNDGENIRFYSPFAETTVGHNRLPHWDQQGSTYFITFRLADSVPASLLRRHREEERHWREAHPEPWSSDEVAEYHRLFRGAFERWLDQGMGDCVLHRPGCASIVAGALDFFEGVRTRVHARVVMPNHVHVLAEILEGYTLPGIMESWKGFSSRAINRRLHRTGALWQKSYYDRLIRDWAHFGNAVRYIRRNPAVAHLTESACALGQSELAAGF